MISARPRWLQERLPTDISKRRVFVTGVVVLMVVLAGCGGSPDDGETTTGMTSPETAADAATPSDGVEMGPGTATESGGAAVTSTASQASAGSGLNVSVVPASTNTTNVTLVARMTVDEESASEGIETVTVDTGGGLDLSTVTASDIDTAGIDEGGALPGNRTSESLAANVEGDVRLANDGRTLTIPLDGNESIAAGDQIVAVIDGGVATTAPGNYSFGLTIDDGPSRTGRYTVTAA